MGKLVPKLPYCFHWRWPCRKWLGRMAGFATQMVKAQLVGDGCSWPTLVSSNGLLMKNWLTLFWSRWIKLEPRADLFTAVRMAQGAGWTTVMSPSQRWNGGYHYCRPYGESANGQIKTGSANRTRPHCKNTISCLRIEEALGAGHV